MPWIKHGTGELWAAVPTLEKGFSRVLIGWFRTLPPEFMCSTDSPSDKLDNTPSIGNGVIDFTRFFSFFF